jgi:hypothetical protein
VIKSAQIYLVEVTEENEIETADVRLCEKRQAVGCRSKRERKVDLDVAGHFLRSLSFEDAVTDNERVAAKNLLAAVNQHTFTAMLLEEVVDVSSVVGLECRYESARTCNIRIG